MSHSPHLPVMPATAPAGPALDQSLLDSDLTPEEVVVVAHGPEKASVLNEDALDRWDSDGGTIPEPSRDPGEPRAARSLPARAIERERGIEGTTTSCGVAPHPQTLARRGMIEGNRR